MKKILLLTLLALLPALASADWQPLPPDQVYRLQVAPQNGALIAHWDILPGYYLYKNKFRFLSHTPGVTLGAAQFPAGDRHQDPYFGDQEIYRDGVTASVPYRGSGPLQLEVVYQGCADRGFCYPPQSKTFNLILAATPSNSSASDVQGSTSAARPLEVPEEGEGRGTPGGVPGAAAGIHPPDLAALVAGTPSTNSFPPPDQVFHFSAYAKDANTIEAVWQINDGYYLYRQKFHFTSSDPNVALGAPGFPQGEIKSDAYFGTSEIYRHGVDAMIPVTRSGQASQFMLTATYQGCADKGLCYPPITKTVNIDFSAPGSAATPAADVPQPAEQAAAPAEQNRLAELIQRGNLAWVLLVFLGLGLLLTFTPCVLPMIPIIAGLIAGQKDKPSTLRAFSLSLTYVLAMALTYTVAGVIVALAGANLQAAFQNPWIVGAFSLIFVLLALAMFGLYELQMPSAIQSRLATWSGRQKSGAFVGVGVMGVLSALIVGPCITAPLVAALLVIGQSGDPLRGGLALFALGLGMGVPLLVVGTSAGKLLPKAGAWMTAVKKLLGVVMLGMAIWFLSRILPAALTLALWAALAVLAGVYLGVFEALGARAPGWRNLWRSVGVLAVLYGLVLGVGAATGAGDPLRPLAHFSTRAVDAPARAGLQFTRVKTLADLDQAVARASSAHKPVMLDFYADWCVSCKEMEHGAFTDARVQTALADTVLLQADVTANDAADQALLRHFGIYGPPSIMFFGSDGQELSRDRVVGYMSTPEFLARIRQALGASKGNQS